MTAKWNFVRQQGFKDASPEACVYQYPALMWQPRAIGSLVLVGLVFQAWPYFLALWVLLWWNVALPRLNLFDALYNHVVAKPEGAAPARPSAQSPPVRASFCRDLRARDLAVPVLWPAHPRVGS